MRSLGTDNYEISGSLFEARSAFARVPLSLDGSPTDTTRVDNSRFDVWFEASYNRFEGSQTSFGHFGVAYIGADYLVSEDLLVGFLVQYDDISDTSIDNNQVVSGNGWMAGPYVTARVSENLYFDGRFAYGQSSNYMNRNLNGLGTGGTGNFDTTRWLVNASLTGDYAMDKIWRFQPNASLSYIEEKQEAFTDSTGAFTGSQTVSMGQLRLGPNFSGQFEGKDGLFYSPTFSFDAIYNFNSGNSSGSTSSTSDDADGLRGRIEAGIGIASKNGVRVDLNANYDGIGQSNYEAWGASIKFLIPFD